MNKFELMVYISRMKKWIETEVNNENYEYALRIISTCASVLYSINIHYMDQDLESFLQKISGKLFKMGIDNTTKFEDNTIVFYDGFGFETRGLAQIYLKALSKSKKVIYISCGKNGKKINKLIDTVKKSGGEYFFLSSKSNIGRINELNNIVLRFKPKSFFFYSLPSDVIATTVMHAYTGVMSRYQINLTDHAFWLGTTCIDYCIEFRDYGASISVEHRKIPVEKIIKIPYYPVIDYSKEFEGYPFEICDDTKVIFSGGSLYKTIGGNNLYYELVEYLVSKYHNNIFWYAGNGDSTELDKLKAKYPNQIVHTSERIDLFQVLNHCYFYLSTYPVCGGLMFQYVASAGKIPLTLRYDSISDDFLINQEQLGIQFDCISDVKNEIDHFMNDELYVKRKENVMKSSVIKESEFNTLVEGLFDAELKGYPFIISNVETEKFRNEYLKNYSKKKMLAQLANKDCFFLIKYMPMSFALGILYKVKRKISRD